MIDFSISMSYKTYRSGRIRVCWGNGFINGCISGDSVSNGLIGDGRAVSLW